jgi:hypothetical protein
MEVEVVIGVEGNPFRRSLVLGLGGDGFVSAGVGDTYPGIPVPAFDFPPLVEEEPTVTP